MVRQEMSEGGWGEGLQSHRTFSGILIGDMKRNKNRFPFSDEAPFRTSTEKSRLKYYKRADERNGTLMERVTVKTRSSRTTDLIKTPKVAETLIIITTKPWNCQNWSGLVSDLSRLCTHYQYPVPITSTQQLPH